MSDNVNTIPRTLSELRGKIDALNKRVESIDEGKAEQSNYQRLSWSSLGVSITVMVLGCALLFQTVTTANRMNKFVERLNAQTEQIESLKRACAAKR